MVEESPLYILGVLNMVIVVVVVLRPAMYAMMHIVLIMVCEFILYLIIVVDNVFLS